MGASTIPCILKVIILIIFGKKFEKPKFSKIWILVFEKSTDEAQNFRNEKPKIQGFVSEKISFQMQKIAMFYLQNCDL